MCVYICVYVCQSTCTYITLCRFEYHWADGEEYKKPTAVSAPVYVDLLMNWIQKQIDNPAVFPATLGLFLRLLALSCCLFLELSCGLALLIELFFSLSRSLVVSFFFSLYVELSHSLSLDLLNYVLVLLLTCFSLSLCLLFAVFRLP
jgi:Mob1/phocein family